MIERGVEGVAEHGGRKALCRLDFEVDHHAVVNRVSDEGHLPLELLLENHIVGSRTVNILVHCNGATEVHSDIVVLHAALENYIFALLDFAAALWEGHFPFIPGGERVEAILKKKAKRWHATDTT